MFERLQELYFYMEDRAEDGVWTGYITKVITEEFNLSSGMQHKLINALVQMGCIVQERRGSIGYPSVFTLVKPPTKIEYDNFNIPDNKPMTTSARNANKVSKLEARVENIEENMVNVVKQINYIIVKVNEIEEWNKDGILR